MTEIFSIEVSHQYFGWKGNSGLKILPTDPTLKLFQKFGFNINYQSSSVRIFSSKNRVENQDYLKYIERVFEGNCFEFKLISEDTNFYNYTEITLEGLGSFNYNSSSSSNTKLQDSTILNFIGLEKGDIQEFAKVQINFNDLAGETKRFLIKLNSMKSRWEYYLINSSGLKLESPFISQIGDKTFQKKGKKKIENNQNAILFKLEGEPIPLTRKVKYRFNLLDQLGHSTSVLGKKNNDMVIFKGLPNPKPSELKIVSNKIGIDISSPMYIYI